MISKTFAVQTIIDKVAKTEAEKAQLHRSLKGSINQPVEFWERLAQIAMDVANTLAAGDLEAGSDGIRIVSSTGPEVTLASRAIALMRVAEGSHRIATRDDYNRWKLEKARRKLIAAGVPVGEADQACEKMRDEARGTSR